MHSKDEAKHWDQGEGWSLPAGVLQKNVIGREKRSRQYNLHLEIGRARRCITWLVVMSAIPPERHQCVFSGQTNGEKNNTMHRGANPTTHLGGKYWEVTHLEQIEWQPSKQKCHRSTSLMVCNHNPRPTLVSEGKDTDKATLMLIKLKKDLEDKLGQISQGEKKALRSAQNPWPSLTAGPL